MGEKYIFQQLIHKKRSLLLKSIQSKMEKPIPKKDNNNQQQRKNKPKQQFKSHFLAQQTESDTPKKNSFKIKIIQWLKQLPLDERYLAVKVYGPGLAKKIQDSLLKLQSDHIQQIKKDISTNRKVSIKQAKQIIQSIVLISDGQQYFDSLGFDFNYIQHPEKLYQLLTLNLSQSEKQLFLSETYQIQQLQLKDSIVLVQKAQTKQQLASFIISFLRADIFTKFQEKKPINLEDQRNRKRQFSMFWKNLSQQNKRKILLLHKQDIKALSNFLEDKQILIDFETLQKEIDDLIQLDKNQFCNRIFKCKLRRSLTYHTDYHELVYKVWKNQLNKKKKRQKNHQRANNQKNLNLQKPSTSSNGISQIQANQKGSKRSSKLTQKQKQANNQKFVNLQPSNCNKEKVSNFNLEKTSKKPVNLGQSIPTVNGGNSTNIGNASSTNNFNSNNKRKRNRNYNNRRKKSVSAESKQTKATSYKVGQQQVQKIQEQNSKQQPQPRSYSNQQTQKTVIEQTITSKALSPMLSKQQNPQTLYFDNKMLLLDQSQTTQSQISMSPSHKINIPPVNYEQEVRKKLLIDISEYSDLINEQANQFYERRIIAYQRIQFILNLWNIPIKLFGSCASGITIKNSDIDIAVDNSILNYFAPLSEGQGLRAALERLQIVFQQQPCVTSLKLIKTAAIPLIKMKIDTSIKFIHIPGYQIFTQYIQILNRQHISSGQIHIDLTIETINKQLQCNHLGIISTDQINKWIQEIKPLHSIVIIIKNYLTKMNLNVTYEGGLNTYSMICMMVAFMRYAKYEEETDIVMVFERMLKFFIYQFDEKFKGIDPISQSQIFYDKLKLKSTKSQNPSQQLGDKMPQLSPSKSVNFCQADLQIKDPLNNGKIMTKNCYSFPKIKQVFKEIYQKCFVDTKNQLQRLFTQRYIKKSIELNKNKLIIQNEQQKSLDLHSNIKAKKFSANNVKKDFQTKYSQKNDQKPNSHNGDKRKKKESDIKIQQGFEVQWSPNNLVNQLIEQCKSQIANPFLTLFQ